ncbi:MAG: STAS domain-containing protein [Desulfarculus sp.]|nr:STAS domain-containing protein [Desulfarculus sp.]
MLTCERQGGAIAIRGELQVQFLESLKEYLLPELNAPGVVVLDLSAVTGVDLAGLQFLLAFAQSRRKHGAIQLANLPTAMNKALALSGIDQRLRPVLG